MVREWERLGMGIISGDGKGMEIKLYGNLGSGMIMEMNHWEWD